MKLFHMLVGVLSCASAILMIIVMPVAALAQEAAQPPSVIDPSSSLYAIWTIVQPVVTLLVTLFGPIVVGIIVGYLVKLLKITDANQQAALEAQLSSALHQSAANAVKYALGKLGLPATAALSASVLSAAVAYVQDKNAGALSKLGVTEDKLKDIITAKAQDIATVPPPAEKAVQ